MYVRNLVKSRAVLVGVFIGMGLAAFVTVWWNNDKYSIKQPIISYDYGKNNLLIGKSTQNTVTCVAYRIYSIKRPGYLFLDLESGRLLHFHHFRPSLSQEHSKREHRAEICAGDRFCC